MVYDECFCVSEWHGGGVIICFGNSVTPLPVSIKEIDMKVCVKVDFHWSLCVVCHLSEFVHWRRRFA